MDQGDASAQGRALPVYTEVMRADGRIQIRKTQQPQRRGEHLDEDPALAIEEQACLPECLTRVNQEWPVNSGRQTRVDTGGSF